MTSEEQPRRAMTQNKKRGSSIEERSRPKKRVKTATKPKSSAKSSEKHGKAETALDELQWSAVPLPDKLDDAEGFFGLEEVDGVNVIRDSDNGRVQYEVAQKKLTPRKQVVNSSTQSADSVIGNGKDSWEGFGSEEGEEGGTNPLLDSHAPKSKTVASQKEKRHVGEKRQDEDDRLLQSLTNGFAGLSDEEDEGTDVSAWESLRLSAPTLLAISKLGFSTPTQIQEATIPAILEGRDLIGKAPTGSGKTLAYAIPILEHFLRQMTSQKHQDKHCQALILSPTRELAHQITSHITSICSHIATQEPRVVTLTGGLSIQKQRRQLENANIVVGTPGRVWEMMREGRGVIASFKAARFLVVDEADRLLNEGHFKEFEEIMNALYSEEHDDDNSGGDDENPLSKGRQTLVFSATFAKDLQQKLTGKKRPGVTELMGSQESMEYLLKKLNFSESKPKFVDVSPFAQMAQGLRENIVECAALEKDLYLYSLLLLHPNSRTLIFTNSISSVRRLTPLLQNLNMQAYGLHSNMPQKARLRSLERFSGSTVTKDSNPRSNSSQILIATDVAARGLDIPAVKFIIHYHVPRTADGYVHRSGRTARASNQGTSILLCAPDEVAGVRRLVAKVHVTQSQKRQESQQSAKTPRLETLELDRRLISRLKPRVALAKKISDTSIAKNKKGREDDWLRNAADELGVEYDSDEFASGKKGNAPGGKGNKSRRERDNDAHALNKADVTALRAQLKELIAKPINVGISERYLTSNGDRLNIGDLMRSREAGTFSEGEFLGVV